MPSTSSKEGVEYRLAQLEVINTRIFELVYYGGFSLEACEAMTSVELKWFHDKLVDIRVAEAENGTIPKELFR